MDYRDFTVLLAAGRDGLEVRVLRSPAGERARAPFACPLSEDDLRRLARLVGRGQGAPGSAGRRHLSPACAGDDRFLEEAGERLFQATFPGPVRERLLESLAGEQGRVRIRLQLDLGAGPDRAGGGPGQATALHRIPWEILRWPDRGEGPVALDRRTPVVRHLEIEGRLQLPTLSGPLGVLVVAPRPGDAPPLALDQEIRELRRTVAGPQSISLQVLDRPTLEGLTEALRGGGIHVLHFMGHGELDPGTGAGALVLEDAAGRSSRVGAAALVEQLGHYLAPLRLVFLNACRTAEAAAGAPWAGVATALARAGVPAVVAMQFPVTDRAAVVFASAVYERLAAGAPVDGAVTDGRLAIRRTHPGSPEWATPALFLRVPDGRLFAAGAPAPDSVRARREGRRGRLVAGLVGGLGLAAVVGGLVLWGGAGEPVGSAREAELGGSPEVAAEEVDVPGFTAGEEAGEPPPVEAGFFRNLGGEDRGAGQVPEPAPVRRSERAASTYPELVLGEPEHLPALDAHVTAELGMILDREIVKVTVSPDGHEPQVIAGFPGSTLRFRFGSDTLSVHLVSLDRDAGTLQVRAARSTSRADRSW